MPSAFVPRALSIAALACALLRAAPARAQSSDSSSAPPLPARVSVERCSGDACYGRVEGAVQIELALTAIGALSASADTFVAAGGRITSTFWLGRWIPSRTFALSFASLGISVALDANGAGRIGDPQATFDSAVRARFGLERALSVSVTATWAPEFGPEWITGAGGQREMRMGFWPLSYRVETLVHLGRHFAVGPQIADAYTDVGISRHRALGATVLFTL